MRRLLFLNGIEAFEAAARSGSFAAFRRWIIRAAASGDRKARR